MLIIAPANDWIGLPVLFLKRIEKNDRVQLILNKLIFELIQGSEFLLFP